MDLRVLFIEDDELIANNLKKIFDGEVISNYKLIVEKINSFREGIELINKQDFDLVVLDLFEDNKEKDEEAGIKVLNEIRRTAFIPVVFYTGYAFKLKDYTSEIVGVVDKGDVSGGINALRTEIERIINSKIAVLKSQIYQHLRESLRKYFWETVDAEKKIFVPGESDVSLGYLLLRRFANSLSKENIKELLGDDKIKTDKAHPMEFYIFPSNGGEYENGEILQREDVFYTILTPTCDFVETVGRKRKVGMVLLAKALPLIDSEFFKKYEGNKDKYRPSLVELIESRKSDRYFFLPGTPFLPNLLIDFQNQVMFDYEELNNFLRVAKLDDPYAQSMVASFIRHYNRIGFPDIDSEYIIQNL